jgi:hypothetical protein
MPTPTYDLIASNVLSSSASSVTFSSIPGTYRDLVVISTVYQSSATNVQMRLNNNTGSIYSRVNMIGNGSTATSGSTTNDTTFPLCSGSQQNVFLKTEIFDYSATDKHKTILSREDGASVEVGARALRFGDTSAITQMQIYTSSSFLAGSTFYLYGIVS